MGDLDLYLYNSIGTQLNSSTSSSNNWELASYKVTTAGNYYLKEDFYSGSAGNYNMIVNLTSFDDSYEPNDAQGSAALITTGTKYNLVGADNDWYYINVAAGYTITANISYNHLIGNMSLQLSNATNILSTSAIPNNDWQLVSFGVKVTGNNYIRVNLTSGSWTFYNLTITIILTDDGYEPNDLQGQATPVSLGTYYSLVALDDDWYYTNIPYGYTFVVNISFSDAIGDLDLYLYNSVGTLLNSSTSASNDWERVSYNIFSTGNYYVKVVLYSGSPVNYAMTLKVTVSGDDLYEDNDAQGQAAKLSAGLHSSLKCLPGDEDWFYFGVEAGSYLIANIAFRDAIGDLDLFLYNAAGSQLNSSTGLTDTEQVSYAITITGNYYIRVRLYSGYIYPTIYDLTIIITLTDDGYENNDNQGQATSISPNTYLSLVGADDDWYYLYVPAGYTLNVNISFNNQIGDLDLWMYNSTGGLLNYSLSSSNNWERMSYTVTVAGNYYLRVSLMYSPTHYDMTVLISLQDDAFEDNDARAQATYLSTGDHNWLVGQDDDWYYLTVDAGSNISIYIAFNDSIGDLDLYLHNPAGTQINSSESASNNWEWVTYCITAAGNYYLRIRLYSGSPTFYNLSISVVSWDDIYEPNDAQGQATLASFATYSNLRCVDDDWFNLFVPAGIRFRVNITFDHLVGNLDLYLYNASGIQLNLSTSASNDWEEVTFAIRVPGNHFIRVVWAGGSWTSYNLTIWYDLPNGDDVFEVNNAQASAAELSRIDAYEELICGNDDWYKIYIEAGNSVTFSIYFLNGFGDLDLKIYDATGALLALSQGTNDYEIIVLNITRSAYYFIQVFRFNPVGSSAYQMYLSTTPLVVDDTYEMNNAQIQAAELVQGTYASLVCADDDWFKVYITAGNTLSVSISFTNSLGNLDLWLYDSTVTLIVYSNSTTNDGESLSSKITTAGYYYIRVNRVGATNGYSLTITPTTVVTPPPPPLPGEIAGYDLFIMAGVCSIAMGLIAWKKLNRRRD